VEREKFRFGDTVQIMPSGCRLEPSKSHKNAKVENADNRGKAEKILWKYVDERK